MYQSENKSDRVVWVFIFLPLLRSEINTFVEVQNAHRIRTQPNRPYHIAGIPNELYFGPKYLRFDRLDADRPSKGYRPNIDLLCKQERLLEDYSTPNLDRFLKYAY